jgi:hypothetical protein
MAKLLLWFLTYSFSYDVSIIGHRDMHGGQTRLTGHMSGAGACSGKYSRSISFSLPVYVADGCEREVQVRSNVVWIGAITAVDLRHQ